MASKGALTYALCVVAAGCATPVVWVGANPLAGLLLLWGPLIILAGVVLAWRRKWIDRSPLLSFAPHPAGLDTLLFVFAGLFHAGALLVALEQEHLERPWMISICLVLFAIGLLLPEQPEIPTPKERWTRWLVAHWRGAWTTISLIALAAAALLPRPSGAFVLLPFLNFCLPATWSHDPAQES